MTLVLDPSGSVVRSLWAVMGVTALDEAREALRKREDIPEPNAQKHIRVWTRGEAAHPLLVDLPQWAGSRNVDAVVWTALPPKFNDKNGCSPTIDQVVSYLSNLTGGARDGPNDIFASPRPKSILPIAAK